MLKILEVKGKIVKAILKKKEQQIVFQSSGVEDGIKDTKLTEV
jgi:hypothetical protein